MQSMYYVCCCKQVSDITTTYFFGAVIFDTRVMSSWEYLCTKPALFVIFFTLFVRTIRSYHHFTSGKINLFKNFTIIRRKWKTSKRKKSVKLIESHFTSFLARYFKFFLRNQWFSLQNWKIDTSLLKPLWLTPGICSKSILLESNRLESSLKGLRL